jgi:hypothetical protein
MDRFEATSRVNKKTRHLAIPDGNITASIKNRPQSVSEAIEAYTTWRGSSTDSNRTDPRVWVHPHRIAFETNHTYPRGGPPLC